MRPELETIEMVRAERDSALAELATLRERLRHQPPDLLRAKSVLIQSLAGYARATKRPIPAATIRAIDQFASELAK